MVVLCLIAAYVFAAFAWTKYIPQKPMAGQVVLRCGLPHLIGLAAAYAFLSYKQGSPLNLLPFLALLVIQSVLDWLHDSWQNEAEERIKGMDSGKQGRYRKRRLLVFCTAQAVYLLALTLVGGFLLHVDLSATADDVLKKLTLSAGANYQLTTESKVLFCLLMFFVTTFVYGRIVAILVTPIPSPRKNFGDIGHAARAKQVQDKLEAEMEVFDGKYSYERTAKDKAVEEKFKVEYAFDHGGDGIKRGALIGYLERLTVTMLTFAGAYQGIAFIITAKSLIRFKQLDNRDYAEYFLVGTLASSLLGIASGLLLRLVLLNP